MSTNSPQVADSSKKKVRGSLKVSPVLAREIVVAAKQQGTTSHVLVEKAWKLFRNTQKTGAVTGPSTGSKDATITELAERAAELAEGLRRIANEESGDAGGDPDRVIEELEQATEVEELKVKAARPARKSPAADREGVTK